MFDRRVIGALVIACALTLGAVTPASAGNGNGNNGNGNGNNGNGNNGNGNGGNPATISAPEIDASSGMAAIALLIGVLGLVVERRRSTAERRPSTAVS